MIDPQLAGDHMTIIEDETGTTIRFDDKGTGRKCGECQLCCRVLPSPRAPLNKPGNTRCIYQQHRKGCRIYANRPISCRTFSCRWLADPETAGMSRPDRSHYVLDPTWDYVTLVPTEGGEPTKVPVAQVWVDPRHRDAYKAPELRAYMLRVAEKHGAATIVRWSSTEALTIFPPCLNAENKWHEIKGRSEGERSEADILERWKNVEITYAEEA